MYVLTACVCSLTIAVVLLMDTQNMKAYCCTATRKVEEGVWTVSLWHLIQHRQHSHTMFGLHRRRNEQQQDNQYLFFYPYLRKSISCVWRGHCCFLPKCLRPLVACWKATSAPSLWCCSWPRLPTCPPASLLNREGHQCSSSAFIL